MVMPCTLCAVRLCRVLSLRCAARIRYAKECLALLQLRRPVQALDAEIKLAKLF